MGVVLQVGLRISLPPMVITDWETRAGNGYSLGLGGFWRESEIRGMPGKGRQAGCCKESVSRLIEDERAMTFWQEKAWPEESA